MSFLWRSTRVAVAVALGVSVASCAMLVGDFSFVSESTDGGPEAGAGGTGSGGSGVGGDAPSSPPPDGGTGGSDGAASPDAEAGTWTPTVLDQAGELALWLEASSANLVISSGAIGEWKDLSQNKNNAVNSQSGPIVDSAAVNGHDAVRFNVHGLVLDIADAASLQLGTDQFFIAAVTKSTTAGAYFFSKAKTSVGGAGAAYATGLEFFNTADTSDAGTAILYPSAHIDVQAGDRVDWGGPALEDGKFHIVGLRRTNSFDLVLMVDDLPVVTGSTGSFDVSQAGQDVLVGSVSYGTFHPAVDFDIAELLVVHDASGVVADTDVADVRAYLKAKYAL